MARTGSFVNNLMSESKSAAIPVIGMGVTELMWTDRYPYEITRITGLGELDIREVNAIRNDDRGMTDAQEYRYESNSDDETKTITLRKDGKWHEKGQSMRSRVFLVGTLQAYYDDSY